MQINDNEFVVNSISARVAINAWIDSLVADFPYWTFSAEKGEDRSKDQNSKMWPMLTDISRQVVWYGKKYSKDDWKDIITGSFRKCDFVPSVEGNGVVMVGLSTSRMKKPEFSHLITYLYAFGLHHGVVWSERSKQTYRDYGHKEPADA